MQTVTLATLPHSDEAQRVQLVLCQPAGRAAYLELREQSWGEGVGWFTQSTVHLGTDQVAALRIALGKVAPARVAPEEPATATQPDAFYPRLLRAE